MEPGHRGVRGCAVKPGKPGARKRLLLESDPPRTPAGAGSNIVNRSHAGEWAGVNRVRGSREKRDIVTSGTGVLGRWYHRRSHKETPGGALLAVAVDQARQQSSAAPAATHGDGASAQAA